jgi:hypothetical protein
VRHPEFRNPFDSAQVYALRSARKSKNDAREVTREDLGLYWYYGADRSAREMTAEDLGLTEQVDRWAPTLTMILVAQQGRIWKRHKKTEVPYAFWLGAEAA